MRHITLGHLEISPRGKEFVNDCLNNNRLSYGKYTREFENRFSSLHGCEYGVFMNSGTSALQVALAGLIEIHGYKNGDEIIVPSTTFIATSNVVIQNNLTPVFVDVDPLTFNIDPEKIEAAITEKTRCIIPVHLFGLPADMVSIMAIAKKYSLQVIEDSCETVGATQHNKSVGSFGDAACFSNYIAHHIVGGVGGLITTNNQKLAELSRSFMAHGRDAIYTNIDMDNSDDIDIRKQMIERRYKFDRVGHSYRCTELEAAIALSELEQIKSNIDIRQRNAKFLTGLLSDLPIQLPFCPSDMTHTYMMYPAVLSSNINRDDFLMHLELKGIETRLMFPLLQQPVYKKLFPGLDKNYPVSKQLTRDGFFIGMHKALTRADIYYVSDIFHSYFNAL